MNNQLRTSIPALFIVLLFTMGSCGTKKKLTKKDTKISEATVAPPHNDEPTPSDYLKQYALYKTFEGRADLNYRDDKTSQNLKLRIKMTRGQDMHISVRALGGMIEAVNALIKPDSLKAIDRINRKVYQLPFDKGVEMIDVPIKFESLQNLLIGEPALKEGKITKFEFKENLAIIELKKDDYTQVLTYNKSNKQLRKMVITNFLKQYYCEATYSDYIRSNINQLFATKITINLSIKGNQKAAALNYSNATFNEDINYHFSIPSRYEQAIID